jgi:peptide/nickel transport system substrate-binding protein
MMQGMFAGTQEKEKTRDTYHGFIFPKIADKISRASGEIDQDRRNALVQQVQADIWKTWPAMWAFAPKAVIARRVRVEDLVLGSNIAYDLARVRLGDEA